MDDRDSTQKTDVPENPGPVGPPEKKNQGFALMDQAKQRELASRGGKAAHQKGKAHHFSSDEAREAGRKGGGKVSQDRAHMAEIGRLGGLSRAKKKTEIPGGDAG